VNLRICLFVVLLVSTLPSKAAEWYEGGTLHKASAREWHAATLENQLASSADMLTATKAASGMDQLKVRATALRTCITEATNDRSLYEQKVADIGALCIVILGYVTE